MVISPYVIRWFSAFVLTQVVEVPVYVRLARVSGLLAFGASAITHPLLWFVLFPALRLSYGVKLVIAELLVWAVEALYLTRVGGVPAKTAMWCAFIANAASMAVGHASRVVFGWP